MTRKNNNTRTNTRKNNNKNVQNNDVFVHVETDTHVEPVKKTATDLAREKAEKAAQCEQARKEAQAKRERDTRLANAFDELTMSVNDALRNVQAHASDELEPGYTVADYMRDFGLTKITVKELRKVLPSQFISEDGICMPTTHAAVYEGAPEDELNGKAIYYCVTKGKGNEKRKIWKKAQTYGFACIKLWSPAIVRRLLAAGMSYADKQERYAKRNAEVKATKQFYVLNEHTETAVSGKVNNRKTVVENFAAIESTYVKWAE